MHIKEVQQTFQCTKLENDAVSIYLQKALRVREEVKHNNDTDDEMIEIGPMEDEGEKKVLDLASIRNGLD